jgi:acyl-CoA synthetase (NDP forming)/GNAT superfamily N-acetyltransferase
MGDRLVTTSSTVQFLMKVTLGAHRIGGQGHRARERGPAGPLPPNSAETVAKAAGHADPEAERPDTEGSTMTMSEANAALTSDGATVTIRPARAADRAALAGLGACRTDRPTVVAIDGTELVGAASYLRSPGCGRIGEVGVVVAGAHRRRGIGTLLLDQLAEHAADRGVVRLVVGATRPYLLPELPDAVTPPWIDEGRPRDAHEYVAEQSPLRRVLAPRSVAVVGAGRQHGGAGHETLQALRDFGFRGRLYAINRSGRPVCGMPTARTMADLPGPVDLLVIAMPPDEAAGVLAAAGRLGARGAVLLGPGHDELLRVAREHNIRLLGPSCLGILNADPRVRLNASLAPARPPGGGVAFAVRSGAVGVALLQDAARDHCGVSTLVSLGDEIDITGTDLLGYWFDDPATRAVVLSPEPFGDPVRFARAARALARRKPVLAIASEQPDDLLAQAGVIRTASVGETLDAARMLVGQPLPAGNRMAIVGNAGGLTALAAGTARTYGFDLVPLSGPTREQLPALADNPVDLGVDALPARIADATEAVANSDETDILLLLLVGTRANVLAATMSALAPVLDDYPRLTVAAVVTGGTGDVHRLGRLGAPVYREPEQAVRALAHARDYGRRRREPLPRTPDLDGPHAGLGRTAIRRAVSRQLMVDAGDRRRARLTR